MLDAPPDCLKAYIIVVTVNVAEIGLNDVSPYLDTVRQTFKREYFEDHLNASCMVILLPSRSGDSKLDFYEFFPGSNISFITNNTETKHAGLLADVNAFLKGLENNNE